MASTIAPRSGRRRNQISREHPFPYRKVDLQLPSNNQQPPFNHHHHHSQWPRSPSPGHRPPPLCARRCRPSRASSSPPPPPPPRRRPPLPHLPPRSSPPSPSRPSPPSRLWPAWRAFWSSCLLSCGLFPSTRLRTRARACVRRTRVSRTRRVGIVLRPEAVCSCHVPLVICPRQPGYKSRVERSAERLVRAERTAVCIEDKQLRSFLCQLSSAEGFTWLGACLYRPVMLSCLLCAGCRPATQPQPALDSTRPPPPDSLPLHLPAVILCQTAANTLLQTLTTATAAAPSSSPTTSAPPATRRSRAAGRRRPAAHPQSRSRATPPPQVGRGWELGTEPSPAGRVFMACVRYCRAAARKLGPLGWERSRAYTMSQHRHCVWFERD